MCGIAGIWHLNNEKLEESKIKRFTDSLFHRGPDGAGYKIFEDTNLGFGHRRLSILDLSEAGKQPMTFASSRYWITFNGEIYNFLELRTELRSKGHTFKTETDTEVILAAYIEWGKNCFQKFNGMWALAIWDNAEKELLLCRDRFGVKPLHYCFIENEHFSFASETIAFKSLDGFKRQYNHTHLIRAIHKHNELEPVGETIYNTIKQVLPGSFLIVKNKKIINHTYWWNTLDNLKTVPQNFDQQKAEFFSIFSDACKLRLRSDVPVASALSGGIDSTAVYCMINWVMKNSSTTRVPNNWHKAFSISFPGSDIDERKYVESVLKQTNGIGVITEPGNSNIVEELIRSTKLSDLISGTPLSCLTYVYKSMHENNIVVSMDGHGADEYLYGYKTSVQAALLESYVNGNTAYSGILEDTLMRMSANADSGLFNKLKSDAKHYHSTKYKIKKILKSSQTRLRGTKMHGNYKLPGFSASTLFNEQFIKDELYLDVINYADAKNSLGEQQLINEFHYKDLPYNLRDFDRGAMQHQIEIRMPFMDYRLVTYAMSLPQQSKLNNGFTKYILREALKGVMPEDIRTRKSKIGLGAPVKDWFNGALGNFLIDLVNKNSKDVSFLNWNLIKTTIENNSKNKSWTDSLSVQYWPIINYLLLEL